MFRIIKLIIAAVIAAYVVIFSVSNLQFITVKPFMNVTSYNIPLFLIIIFSLLAGFIIGAIAMYGEKITLKSQNRKQNKVIKEQLKEIDRLKKLTISGKKIDESNNENVLAITNTQNTTVLPVEILSDTSTENLAVNKKDDDIKAALK